jgi:Zn-dependent protease with chaperone function
MHQCCEKNTLSAACRLESCATILAQQLHFGRFTIDASFTAPSGDLAAQLTRPTASYKNSARLAVAGLLLFVTLYFALAGWFLYTPWRVFFGGAGSDLGVIAWIMALCSLFIGAFMVKAIFSVKNAKPTDLHEITAQEQPRLFAFLFELADAAGAPRPHKVFLSARVNAAVFYDLSLFNLIFPSKKNLEIGLALVNTVSLGEFRAVLAHEFGHFAQRSMAVGRWVYVAQQIATHLVTRRDALDDFLVTLGNIDLRVRVVVGAVQLVIWSIRSLVESLFNAVILMQRALSREMEMQADLVAVSLTGSDALIHALHRLQGADDAWDRALHFVFGERGAGRATRDVFAVQTHMLARMSAILNDKAYAEVPPLPAQGQDRHRIFKVELAQPPKMWLTHPLNHEREANAKRIYVPAPIDPASAWSVFNQPAALREQMTARVLGESQAAAVELEESLKTLARQFKREQYNRRYCGIFFGRQLARHVDKYQQLRDPHCKADIAELAALYPESLAADVHALRALETQAGQLQALISGAMSAPGKVVRLNGVEFRKKQLPAALAGVRGEIAALTARLQAHDHLCRSWHHGQAVALGGGWSRYLDGLLALIHYAEHSAANVQDAQGMLNNAAAIVTAVRRVTAEGVSRVVMAANDLHHLMEQIHREAGRVLVDPRLRERMELGGTWRESLEEFTLPLAQNDNINEWLRVIDGWVDSLVNSLNALRSAALEELLLTETMIARHARSGGQPEAAPAPSLAPDSYALLPAGAERKRQTRLGPWARFQRADGLLPGSARLLVAGAIVVAVLGASSFNAGHGTSIFNDAPALMVHNGLDIPAVVNVDGHSVSVAPGTTAPLALPAFGKHHVEARSADGRLIESFNAEARSNGHPVYNVAGAAPLVEWSATYGRVPERPQRLIGALRWLDSAADDVFRTPPKSVSGTKYSDGSYRTVLEGLDKLAPLMQLQVLGDDKERQRVAMLHARWDRTDSTQIQSWMDIAGEMPGFAPMLAQRLKEAPADVLLRREQSDHADEAQRPVLCVETGAQAAASPDDANLKYLSLRCMPDSAAQAAQLKAAARRWPANPWLANAMAFDHVESLDWSDATVAELEKVRRMLPSQGPALASNIGRVMHYLDPRADLSSLAELAPQLAWLVRLDKGEGAPDSPERAYADLAKGQFEQALLDAKADPARHAHVLRLAAASDGAGAALAAQALALRPEDGMDSATAWLPLAMAMRSGSDSAPQRALAVAAGGRYGQRMLAFLDSVKKGADPRVSERLLEQVHPTARAYAYSAAIVLAGRKAPQAWRDTVRRLLFASERPYFT